MWRYFATALCLAFLTFSFAGIGRAAYFTDISAMAPLNYYNAIPDGVNSSGAVSMQGYSSTYHSTNSYYHTYVYSGGTAAGLSDITSDFAAIHDHATP